MDVEILTSICRDHLLNLDGNKQTSYRVYVGEDTYYKADLLGSDPVNDLAVLTFKCPVNTEGLQPIKGFYNEDGEETITDIAKVGSYVVAIGCPLDLDNFNYPTFGLVGKVSLNAINHSAPINPGNSGGALVNAKGEVIGINTVKVTDTTVEGLGFAIPSDDALKIIEELKLTGKIVRPYIGIYGIDMDEATAQRNKLVEGVYVYQVFSGSPAEAAGISRGDIIVEFDGQQVKTKQELNNAKNKKSIGDKVKVKVYRGGDYQELEITLSGDDGVSSEVTN